MRNEENDLAVRTKLFARRIIRLADQLVAIFASISKRARGD